MEVLLLEISLEYCGNQRWRWLWIWSNYFIVKSEALKRQPCLFAEIWESSRDGSILLYFQSGFHAEDRLESIEFSQTIIFGNFMCFRRIWTSFCWWMKNIYEHFNKVFNIILKMYCADGISKSIGEYNVFYTFLTLKVWRSSCWMWILVCV